MFYKCRYVISSCGNHWDHAELEYFIHFYLFCLIRSAPPTLFTQRTLCASLLLWHQLRLCTTTFMCCKLFSSLRSFYKNPNCKKYFSCEKCSTTISLKAECSFYFKNSTMLLRDYHLFKQGDGETWSTGTSLWMKVYYLHALWFLQCILSQQQQVHMGPWHKHSCTHLV